MLLHRGLTDDAVKILERSIEESGGEPVVLSNYALALGLSGNGKKADAIFDAADFWAAENRHAKAVIAFSRSILRFSDGFARPLNVEFDDGRKQSADVFLRQLVEFWVQQEKDGAF